MGAVSICARLVAVDRFGEDESPVLTLRLKRAFSRPDMVTA